MSKINSSFIRSAYAAGGPQLVCMVLVAYLLIDAGYVKKMYTIPTDFELMAIPFIIAFAVIFCACMYIYRYAEHNEAKGLDRSTNKQKVKFIVGAIIATVITAFLGYVGSCVVVEWINPADVGAADYIVAAFPIELFSGLILTVLISEGITGFGKFFSQKIKEAKEAVAEIKAETNDISPEAAQALINALSKVISTKKEETEVPKEE